MCIPPIKATLNGENCIYLMNERDDIYRVWFGFDGIPLIEACALACPNWPPQIVAEHNRVSGINVADGDAHGS